MAANIAASAEIIDHGPSNAMNEQDEGHHLLEDEGTTSSSGSVGLQQSPVWEVDGSEAPPCIKSDILYLLWLCHLTSFDKLSIANFRIISSTAVDLILALCLE